MTLGCGNSLLSEKMWRGLELAQPITAIDFEEGVIKKMKNRGPKGVDYLVMDVTNMTFDACEFDFAVDKGTLDALCADRSPESAAKVTAYLNEVCRVIYSKGGMFVCVSLLQDFVLDALISFFNKGIGNEHAHENIFDFRIQKVERFVKAAEG